MRQHILTAVVLIFINSIGHAQTKKISLLTKALEHTKFENEKVNLYNELGENYFSHDLEKGLEYENKSLNIAIKINDARGIAQAFTSIGTYYYHKGDNQNSQTFYHKALAAINDTKSVDYPIKTYLRLSVLYRRQAYFDSAQFYLSKANDILQTQQVSQLHAMFYASSGILANAMAHNDKALLLLKKSLRLRMLSPDTVRLANTLKNIGVVYTDLAMYDSAQYCYTEASKLMQGVDEPETQMLLSLSKGETNFARGNLNEAMENYKQAIDFIKTNIYKRNYAYVLLRIGELYLNRGAYQTAYEYLFNALKEFETVNARQDMAKTYSQIGWCYNHLENFSHAIENGNKSLAIATLIQDSASIAQNHNLLGYALLKTGKYQEAMFNFEKALTIRKKIKFWWGATYTMHNMALTQVEMGNTQKAFDLLFEALDIEEKVGNKGAFVYTCNELGLLYAKNEKYDKAIQYLNQAQDLAKKIPLTTQLIANYKNFIFLFEQKHYAAQTIKYYRLYTQLKDSVANEASANKISKEEALFQLQKIGDEMKLAHKENELKQERINSQQQELDFKGRIITVVTIAIVALLVLVVIIYRLLTSRTKGREKLRMQNIEILEQKEEIQTQSEELSESNARLSMLNDELIEKNIEIESQSEKIQEANTSLEKRVDERTHQLNLAYQELETFFYRTSHDFRRPLTTYLGLAEIAKTSIKDQQALDLFEKVRETTLGLDKMLVKLQSISNIDFENQLGEYSLNQLIFDCIEKHQIKINAHNIKVIANNEDFLVKINEHLFKTFFENIVENAVYFCSPFNPFIKIITAKTEANFSIIVEDNGQGISATVQHKIFEMYFRGNDNSKGNGLGLYIAKKAIDKLNGTIAFISRLNEGTSFKITIPINR